MPVVIVTKTHSLEDPALVAFNWQHSTPLDAIGGSSATSETASLHHWMRARYSFLLTPIVCAPRHSDPATDAASKHEKPLPLPLWI